MKRLSIILVLLLPLLALVGVKQGESSNVVNAYRYVVSTNDLVSFWKLDEASGTRSDAFGSNDLTDNNTVGQGTGTVYANAADFESTNSEYLSDPDDASHPSGSFTFSFWAKFESLPPSSPWPTLAHKWATSQQEWLINYTSDGIYFHCDDDGTSNNGAIGPAPASGGLSTGTWYHFCVRHDNGVGRSIWVNGVNEASDSYAAGIHNGTGVFELGGFSGAGLSNHDGLIEAAGWWNRALSDAEITALANSNDPFYDQF